MSSEKTEKEEWSKVYDTSEELIADLHSKREEHQNSLHSTKKEVENE